MGLQVHKKGQGFYTRFTVFILASMMGLYGAYRMFLYGGIFSLDRKLVGADDF
jgi:hypothetical protein